MGTNSTFGLNGEGARAFRAFHGTAIAGPQRASMRR